MKLHWHISWPFDPSLSNDRPQEQSNWVPEDRCVTIAQGPLLWQWCWLSFSSPGAVLSSWNNKSRSTKYSIATAKFGSKENNRKFTPTLSKEMQSHVLSCPGTHSFRSMHGACVTLRSSVGLRVQTQESTQRIQEDSVTTMLVPRPGSTQAQTLPIS